MKELIRSRWALLGVVFLAACTSPAPVSETKPSPPKASFIDRLLPEAKAFHDASSQAKALAAVAGAYAEAGDKDKAAAVLSEAVLVLNSETKPAKKAGALGAIASNYAKAGKYDQALELAKGIKNPYDRASVLATVGAQYVVSGQKSEGLKLLAQAHSAANTTFGASYSYSSWSISLSEVAGKYAESGETEQALRVAQGI